MKNEDTHDTPAATSEAGRSRAIARDEAYHRFRLLATMLHGTAVGLPQAWQSYGNVDDARRAAWEMMRNDRVLHVAIVEDRVPMEVVEWIGRQPDPSVPRSTPPATGGTRQ